MGAKPEDFPVGAVVRLTAEGGRVYPRTKYRCGVVTGIRWGGHGDRRWWLVRVKARCGRRFRSSRSYEPDIWEVVPHGDLSADEAARALANAVLAGDREAARALADRVMELCQEGGAG